jgi:hypothetical protein
VKALAHGHEVTLQPGKLVLGPVGTRTGVAGLLVGVVALGAAALLGLKEGPARLHFFHSYLFAYCFFLAITFGSLAYVMIHYLARVGWSVTVRRLAEALALNMFLLAILILPMLGGLHELFPRWFVESTRHADEALREKSGYLNPTFFFIRLVAYFVIWCGLAAFFAAKSKQQDRTGDPAISKTMERVAMPGMWLFAFSLTGFVFDWVMSLNPYWFSTMFGVYFFAGSMLSMFAAIVLLSQYLKNRGLIGDAVNTEHYHDLGKWMFAFTFFWGYIAFGQYMLIWYANIPEETQFFIPRQMGVYASLSLLLLIVHLVIPFPGLLSRHVKRRNGVIAFWAVWSLCACMLDAWYMVVPNEWINQIPAAVGHPTMPIANALPLLAESTQNMYTVSARHQDFVETMNYPLQAGSLLVTALCVVGIGGLYVFSTMLALRGRSLVPQRDPRLPEALAFENM